MARALRFIVVGIVAFAVFPSYALAGALTEAAFLEAFEQAGFYGLRILERAPQPWRTVRGIEFRSVTVEAFKGKQGACFERRQAVIYKGPFAEVTDELGTVFPRGQRVSVDATAHARLRTGPLAEHFAFLTPAEAPTMQAVTAPAKDDCNPPYYFEGSKKIFKQNCL